VEGAAGKARTNWDYDRIKRIVPHSITAEHRAWARQLWLDNPELDGQQVARRATLHFNRGFSAEWGRNVVARAKKELE
jgi:hypothetical protein